jgi:hypothetical protein
LPCEAQLEIGIERRRSQRGLNRVEKVLKFVSSMMTRPCGAGKEGTVELANVQKRGLSDFLKLIKHL